MSGMHFLPLRFLESASSLSEADITSDILAEIQTYENSHSLNCICGAEGARKKKLAMFLLGCSGFLDKCFYFPQSYYFDQHFIGR